MNSDIEQQMRDAARDFFDSSSSYSVRRPLLGQNHSINLLASQEAASGWQREGRMSSVRRFFCLYCTFDMLFTTLVWLICVMVTGESIWDMWKTEVLSYTFSTSLIDVPGVALIRFVILLLAYAAIHLNHWTVVALTTSGTCMFLIAKVFLFDWTKASQPVFEVFLVLVSFSLCWSEAWFLDCKVLPSELQAREILESVDQPIISGNRIGVPSDVNSIADYYSPRDSPSNSPILGRKIVTHQLTSSTQNDEYIKRGEECLDNVIKMLADSSWKDVKKGKGEGEILQTMETEKYGKVYLMTCYLDCPPEFLYKEFSENVEDIPTWNSFILESKIITKIDQETDITYQLTSGGGGGAVKPRDFIILRCNAVRGDRYFSCGTSVEYPGYPPTKKYIRGDNKISCWCIQPMGPRQPDGRTKCKFNWLMGADLKGWIPQYILDAAFSTTMLDFIDLARAFVEKKRLEKAF